ncbi:MAG: hypothetical protein BJ554DRAFT_4059, partial [Olpidium bornovanus]
GVVGAGRGGNRRTFRSCSTRERQPASPPPSRFRAANTGAANGAPRLPRSSNSARLPSLTARRRARHHAHQSEDYADQGTCRREGGNSTSPTTE